MSPHFVFSNSSNRLPKHHEFTSPKLRLDYPFWIRILDTPTFNSFYLFISIFFCFLFNCEGDPILLVWVRVTKLGLRIKHLKHIHSLSQEIKHFCLGEQGWLWILLGYWLRKDHGLVTSEIKQLLWAQKIWVQRYIVNCVLFRLKRSKRWP